ncbi:MAG: PLP-dependent aminotransferase family protein, partial [Firmicutes bacterium]|nr:PLP-dependent aminotransferase family protein [Bacillota bacterium]
MSKYLELYEKLRGEIADGLYPFGSRFPSKRTIADRYGVSLVTAEHSLSLLCDEGYLEARQRSGFFVAFRESDLFAPGTAAPEPVASFPQPSETDFPFSVLAKIMRRVLSEYGERILEKGPNSGLPELKNAIRDYLARSRGIRVSTERIIIGSGSEYLYGLIVQLLGRERVYAIEKPSYIKIEQVYRANGIEPELLSLGSDGILSSELERSRASVLHITPYRSFPSGISTSASKRREYVRWAEQRNGHIIEDDFESEFTPSSKPEETVFSLAGSDNV